MVTSSIWMRENENRASLTMVGEIVRFQLATHDEVGDLRTEQGHAEVESPRSRWHGIFPVNFGARLTLTDMVASTAQLLYRQAHGTRAAHHDQPCSIIAAARAWPPAS